MGIIDLNNPRFSTNEISASCMKTVSKNTCDDFIFYIKQYIYIYGWVIWTLPSVLADSLPHYPRSY